MGNKCDYLPSTFWSENAEIICPEDLYMENPEYGLRDIALKVVSFLRQNKQVLIDDELRSRLMRKSLLETLKKKVPSCRVKLVQLIPKYGLLQVLWSLQWAQAAGMVKATSKDEEHLKLWFDSSLHKIDYTTGFVDEPDEKEGYVIETLFIPLQVKSHFRMAIPALFFQWECAMNEIEELNSQVTTLCSLWSAQNPHGCILFICDGRNIAKGIIPVAEETNNVVRILKQLSVKINHTVYALQLHAASSTRHFCIPPQPGILAFLQLRHLLNLHSKSTCYVFDDITHMKMAEAAGMRHAKITAVLKSPGMVLKGCGSNPSVPAMLKSMVVEKPGSGCKNLSQTPTVPTFDCHLDIKDGHASHRFENGLEEHVFVKDMQSFHRYQEKYAQHITPIEHSENKFISMEPLQQCESTKTEKVPAHVTRSSSEDSTDVDIPHWMRRKKPRLPSDSESVTVCPQKTVSKNLAKSSRSYQTVYIMSEKEVLEMAQQVLQEVGTDIITAEAQQTEHKPC
ncbi:unnamed protein product [Candidula unifasciata]|uniref:Uncharacterized protein n=1 Tax=Candidula unifasciata TaxID=100452 RepID=A0A8S3Z9Q4_9EUPU|nr:unnamed protein product [Candidula unifasciata]